MKSQSDPTPFRVPVAPRVFTRALLCALCASVVNLSPAATIPIADPFVLLHNDTYYAYGTGDETDPDGVFHVYTSKNLRVWRKHPPVLRRADIAAAPVIATRFFWAPEVVYRQSDQKFYLFYTASNDTSNSEHLYVATADSPLGPFTNISALLPDTRAIDSTLVFDGDIPLLFFVRTMSGQNIIHSARLNSDWKSLATSPVEVLRPTETWENGCTEGPSIIGPRNGTYYLLYSGNWYDNQNYSVGYATSKSLNGPWTKYPSNPILKKSATHNLYGPGHGGPFWDKDGVRRYIFHSHASDSAWNPRHLQI
ncbi:MAG: glycoside hydrolase family 43 protein, partial [Opitutaceae bacterium]|nr:glycoside hydrolase family 43 protein [Opitutaceae bacterium]